MLNGLFDEGHFVKLQRMAPHGGILLNDLNRVLQQLTIIYQSQGDYR